MCQADIVSTRHDVSFFATAFKIIISFCMNTTNTNVFALPA